MSTIKNQPLDFRAVMGCVQTFLVTQEETDGEYVEVEIVMDPGAGGSPRHVHPHQEERFEVTGGIVDVFHSGRWHRLEAGDVAVVPPGMPDQFQNTSDQPATVLVRLTPALDFQAQSLVTMKLIDEGKITSAKDLRSIIYGLMLLKRFPRNVRMLNPSLRWTTSALAFIGRRLRYSID